MWALSTRECDQPDQMLTLAFVATHLMRMGCFVSFCLVDLAIGLGNATGITYTDIEDVMVHNVHSDVTKDGPYSSG